VPVFKGANHEEDLMVRGDLTVRLPRLCAWAGRVSTGPSGEARYLGDTMCRWRPRPHLKRAVWTR